MWTPEHQAAFEANHSAPKVDPLSFSPDRPERSFRERCWQIAKWSFLFFVIGLIWAVLTNPSHEWAGFHLLQDAMMIPFAVILVLAIIIFPFAFGWSMWKALSGAVDAVQTPSPHSRRSRPSSGPRDTALAWPTAWPSTGTYGETEMRRLP